MQFAGVKSIYAQGEYTLVGSARPGASSACVQLTGSGNDQVGAVWFNKRLPLTETFTLIFIVNLGNNPTGSDGLALVFQTQGNQVLGGQAGGIGYKGLSSSLSVEFDTHQNLELGDPATDHIALMRDGVADHRLSTEFAAPVPLSASQNSKDGRNRYVKVIWEPSTRALRVEVDCVPRISQTIDLVNTVFSGTSEVIWGFTAATGGGGNVHTVCMLNEEKRPEAIQACRNELITLTAPLSFDGRYQWTPSTGLDNPQSRTPQLKVGSSQLYTVQYTDQCSQLKRDSVFIAAKNPNLTIGGDRQACENDTVTLQPALLPVNVTTSYRWSTGQTRAQIQTTTSGLYSLTMTTDGCSISDSAKVVFNPVPKSGLLVAPVYDCPGSQPIQLDPKATGTNLRYAWTPDGSQAPTLSAYKPGVYTVQITTGMGCSATQAFTLLDNCPSLQIFVPDAFTPNGDGINDVLMWQGSRDSQASMKVFSRWGEVLFESSAAIPYWDGTHRGNPCPSATYTWSLTYRPTLSANQPEFTSQGQVLLLR